MLSIKIFYMKWKKYQARDFQAIIWFDCPSGTKERSDLALSIPHKPTI